MNYFGFCGEDVPIIRKKRNSFSSLEFYFNNNKEINNYKYHTIDNKKDIFIKKLKKDSK